MTDARPQLVSAPSISRTLAMTGGGFLIFAGLVFQLGEFLCDRLNAPSYWLLHMIASNIWNMLVLKFSAPGLADFLRFWPLLLVGFGLAILLALQPARE